MSHLFSFFQRHLFSALNLIVPIFPGVAFGDTELRSPLPVVPPVGNWRRHERETYGQDSGFSSNLVLSSVPYTSNDLLSLNTQNQNMLKTLKICEVYSRHHHAMKNRYMGVSSEALRDCGKAA